MFLLSQRVADVPVGNLRVARCRCRRAGPGPRAQRGLLPHPSTNAGESGRGARELRVLDGRAGGGYEPIVGVEGCEDGGDGVGVLNDGSCAPAPRVEILPPQCGHFRASMAHTRELRPRTPRRRPSSCARGAWVRRAPQRGQGGKPGQGVGTMSARTRRGFRAAGPVKTPWKRRNAR
jgi:hypothetical protein